MPPAEATRYRGIAARLNFLAQDRVDLQYACKEASRRMAKPQRSDWAILKRIGRYLVGCPRYIQKLPWQSVPVRLDTFTDSDWAGCKATCRSTSGGVVRLGEHCLKTWSSTQATVALSSAEAELYALTKGAAQALGMLSLLADFGVTLDATVHTDASAAIGILRRKGLGKIRHLNVRYLWLQDQTRTGTNLAIAKVPGLENPADIVTKYLNSDAAQRHLDKLHVTRSCGRAETALVLAAIGWAADAPEAAVVDKKLQGGRGKDAWADEAAEGEMVRIHRQPRRELFTPLRVSGAPPAKALATLRVTSGRFAISGRAFRIVDRWTARAGAHRDIGEAWTGTTTFIKMSAVLAPACREPAA